MPAEKNRRQPKSKKKTAAKRAARVRKPSAAKAAKDAARQNACSIYDVHGKAVGSFELDALFVKGPVHTDLLYQSILMYQAGEREGTAATKTRGEVRGGGKKPWKQKGTGQARHGSRRSPIWRGGGVTFGPHPRDYSYTLPAQMKRSAVAESVKEKASNQKLFVIEDLKLKQPKTREVVRILDALKLRKPLVLVDKRTPELQLAVRNLSHVSIKTADEVNALDVSRHQECLMTKAAYQGLVKRLKS